MAKVTVENSDSLSKLVFTGELDIYSVSDVYTNFLRDFSTANQVKIHLKEISSFDCAGIQLLIAFFKNLKEKNVHYQIVDVSESVLTLSQQLNLQPWFLEPSI